MAKQPETRFKEIVLRNLRALPNLWVAKIQQVAKRGTPDLLCCIDGHFVAIELKRAGTEEPDPLQEWNLESISESGGIAIVCYPENWPVVFEFLKKLAGQEKSEKGKKWVN
jgi:hypothetical protein